MATERKIINKMLVCDECEGTCPWYLPNYEEILHEEKCKTFEEYKIIHRLKPIVNLGKECQDGIFYTFTGYFKRTCPAFMLLVSPFPFIKVYRATYCDKEKIENCYEKYFAKFEAQIAEEVRNYKKLS